MKKYFGKFASSGDVQTAVDSGALSKPYVAVVGNEMDYNSKEVDYASMPLTLKILSGGTLRFAKKAKTDTYLIKVNDGEWESYYDANAFVIDLVVKEGDVIQYKSTGFTSNTARSCGFINTSNYSTCYFNVYGNIMSLVDSTNYASITSSTSTFKDFFNKAHVVDASHLILQNTTLETNAYDCLFNNCTNLIAAPTFSTPVSMKQYAFHGTFAGCVNLETVPIIPYCETIYNGLYNNLFNGCTKINYIKALFPYRESITTNWVQGVAATGTFVKKAGVNWPSGNNGIPEGWTVVEE